MDNVDGRYDTRSSEKDRSSRREFLRLATTPIVGAAIGLSFPSCKADIIGPEDTPGITINGNTIILDLSEPELEQLTREGGFLLIREATIMAVNIDGETIRAFTSTCTHQQCTITTFDNGRFQCPCHDSHFNTSGQVVQGPAEEDLEEFEVDRNGEIITISK